MQDHRVTEVSEAKVAEQSPDESPGLCPRSPVAGRAVPACWAGVRMTAQVSLSCPGARPEPGRPGCQTAARSRPRPAPHPAPPQASVSVCLPSQPEKPLWPVTSELGADLLARCLSAADPESTHFLPRSPGPAGAAPRPPVGAPSLLGPGWAPSPSRPCAHFLPLPRPDGWARWGCRLHSGSA